MFVMNSVGFKVGFILVVFGDVFFVVYYGVL